MLFFGGVTAIAFTPVVPDVVMGPVPLPHPEAPPHPNLADAVEEATDIFYLTITDYYGAHCVEAEINSILMGSYTNKIWCDRRISGGDPYPFTPGEEYVLFLFETMGDTYKLLYYSAEWAIHRVDGNGLVDVSAFADIEPLQTVAELADNVARFADPFYLEER